MNTKAEIERLTLAVCERLDLTLMQVMDVQVDLANDYLLGLSAQGYLNGPDDAQLMVMLPEFWGWWRQRWANQDRALLAQISGIDLLEWRARGADLLGVYRGYCRSLASPVAHPNSVLMAAFEAEKRKQIRAYLSLKNLFNNL